MTTAASETKSSSAGTGTGTSGKKKTTKDTSSTSKKPGSSGSSGTAAGKSGSSRPSSATTKKKASSSTSASATSRKKKDGSGSGSGAAGGSSNPSTKLAPSVLSAVATAALKAERELQQARAETEARQNDSAWLRPDLITRMIEKEETTGNRKPSLLGFLSDEAAVVDGALAKNGLSRQSITPQAYGCLLEYSRKFSCELVADAHDYAWHAGRSKVSASDLELACDMRENSKPFSDGGVSSQEELMFMAEDLNRVPLPLIPSYCYSGIALPPQSDQLTARTFDVVSSAASLRRKRLFSSAAVDNDEFVTDATKLTKKDNEPWASYGANKSKRISVTLESHHPKPPETTMNTSTGAPSSTGTALGETSAFASSTTSYSATPMDLDNKDSPATGVERRAAIL